MSNIRKDFDELVVQKYQLYNSLFLTLPFSDLSRYGAQLPLFTQVCKESLEGGETPEQIVTMFLESTLALSEEQREPLLFLFLQLIERQVLLFDAIESAAHNRLFDDSSAELIEQLGGSLTGDHCLRIVLTAHPTQFYPPELLGIIADLRTALQANDVNALRELLLQLGHTSFRNQTQPSPLQEAELLIQRHLPLLMQTFVDLAMQWPNPPRLELGFWPGGDRDGHPLVTVDTTRAVAARLRETALQFHLGQMEVVQRRITFKGCVDPIRAIVNRLHAMLRGDAGYGAPGELRDELLALREQVQRGQGGLFVETIDRALHGLTLFGFHLASLDIRQSSEVQGQLFGAEYGALSEEQRIDYLLSDSVTIHSTDDLGKDLLAVVDLTKEVQVQNGPKSIHRYIISHCEHASHLLEALLLTKGTLDIVPLFESIEDLRRAPAVMAQMLQLPRYRAHLDSRGAVQTVMLGFSDGTKDGGYLSCNWEIQRCKERLYALGRDEGIEFTFFDGRGGPPSRGGGHTHTYYQAISRKIPLKEIQLTIQGQSISSLYGTQPSATYNTLQLLSAFNERCVNEQESPIVKELADLAGKHYQALREQPEFIPLLTETTPLSLLGELNIASRPVKRSPDQSSTLDNLRAISFVGAWSLMKVNLPAFYGMGRALEALIEQGRLKELQALHKESHFFRALLGNAGQALRKSYAPLTQYLEADQRFGLLWSDIRGELARASTLIMQVAERDTLMEESDYGEASVALREDLILPLLVIQHAALQQLRRSPENQAARKRLLKSIPASINASRNSA